MSQDSQKEIIIRDDDTYDNIKYVFIDLIITYKRFQNIPNSLRTRIVCLFIVAYYQSHDLKHIPMEFKMKNFIGDTHNVMVVY